MGHPESYKLREDHQQGYSILMALTVSVDQVESLFRPLNPDERTRATALIPVVVASLKQEAKKTGCDLDQMVQNGDLYEEVFVSVVVDVVARTLMTSTNTEPMTQFAQSALGYSTSGTFLVPGGGLFIKKSELARLGLRCQKIQLVSLYGPD